MIVIRDRDGNVASASLNLRGIARYPSAVERVDIWPSQLGVTWTDGASTTTTLSLTSHAVMSDWIKGRRIFRNVPIKHH